MIETVPNLSEGRRPDIVADLSDAVRQTPGARLLDVSSDPSHNRSVFTLVGDATGVAHAILALTARAVADIDVRTHTGVHPRVGAIDVVPFIPLAGSTMADCITVARTVGAAIATQFGIPVFLYEEAARHPHRRRLEHIRRGGLAALAARMTSPEWTPDFGPSSPHQTAGVTVVGARRPLIAFNVNLDTDRLDVATAVAGVVRASGGGLPALKALGLRLDESTLQGRANRVQVSMNLTNYEETSLVAAFDAVRREAAKRGVEILESELVGLVPEAAIAGIDPAGIGLKAFSSDRILERRLEMRAP